MPVSACFLRFALVWGFVIPAITLIAAEPDRRERTYDTPEKAFLGYQKAVDDEEGKHAYEAITTESQNTLLYDQWAGELTGESARLGISELIDHELRQKLTREHLPTARRDLPALFVKSIPDRKAAFEKIVKTLNRYRRNHLQNLQVKSVKIKGDNATAKLVFKRFPDASGPDSDPLHFLKDEQGWLVDLRPAEAHAAAPELDKVPFVAPDQERGRHPSPEAAFDAFKKGLRERNVALAWHAMTPEYRADFLFNGRRQLLGEHGDNLVLHWYGDHLEFARQDKTNPPPSEQGQRAVVFVRTRYDQPAFFGAILKRRLEIEQTRGRRVRAELAEVKLKNDGARGVVKYHFEPLNQTDEKQTDHQAPSFAYRLPCYFRQVESHWYIDLPTREERQREQQSQQTAREERKLKSAQRERTFRSPKEAYAAFTEARRRWDAAAVRDCLAAENNKSLIYVTWAEQFHFQNDPPTLHEFIDEDRRRQLTREQVPIEDFAPLLIDSLTDLDGAFAASLHSRLVSGVSGEIQDVQLDGETATGKLIDRTKPKKSDDDFADPQESDIGFRKDQQGWVIDFSVRRKDDREQREEPDETTKSLSQNTGGLRGDEGEP